MGFSMPKCGRLNCGLASYFIYCSNYILFRERNSIAIKITVCKSLLITV